MAVRAVRLRLCFLSFSPASLKVSLSGLVCVLFVHRGRHRGRVHHSHKFLVPFWRQLAPSLLEGPAASGSSSQGLSTHMSME